MESKKRYLSEFKRPGKKRPPRKLNKNGIPVDNDRPAYFLNRGDKE